MTHIETLGVTVDTGTGEIVEEEVSIVPLPRATATPTALLIHGYLTTPDWLDLYDKLSTVEQATPWLLGDLMLNQPSEECSQVLDEYNKQTLQTYAWVCRQITPAYRRPELSFSHHQLVAGYGDLDLITELLEVAIRQGLSRDAFRTYLKAYDAHLEEKEPEEPKERIKADPQAALALAESKEGTTWTREDTGALKVYLGL